MGDQPSDEQWRRWRKKKDVAADGRAWILQRRGDQCDRHPRFPAATCFPSSVSCADPRRRPLLPRQMPQGDLPSWRRTADGACGAARTDSWAAVLRLSVAAAAAAAAECASMMTADLRRLLLHLQ